MKLFKRVITLTLAVCIIASLCSCKELDKARQTQAFYGEDTSSVIFGGQKYTLIDTGDYSIGVNFSNYGNITKSDVPVLLANALGNAFRFDDKKEFISSTYGVYCREDKYEEVKNTVENPNLSVFYYSSYEYNDEKNDYEEVYHNFDYNAFTSMIADTKATNRIVDDYGSEVDYKINGVDVFNSTEDYLISQYFCSIEAMSMSNNTVYALSGSSQLDSMLIIPEKYYYLFEGIEAPDYNMYGYID